MWAELRKLLKHTGIYGLGGLLGKLAGFLLIPFYTHYLRPAEYGTLELLDLTLSLTAMLLNVWMAAPLINFYYEYEDQREKGKVVSTALVGASVGGAILCLAGFSFSGGLSAIILKTPAYSHYFRIICVSFFLCCVNSVTQNYIQATQRSVLRTSVELLSLVVTLSLNVYFIAGRHLGVAGLLYSSLVANFLTFCFLTTLTLREVGLAFDYHKLELLARFAAPLIVTNIGAFVLNFSDRFFLQRYTSLSTVGVYALGYKFGFMLNFLLIQPFSMIWSARMYEIARTENAGVVFSTFAEYFCLVLVTAGLALSLVVGDLITVIAPPDFRGAFRVVPLVALGYTFRGMTYFFQSGILIRRLPGYMGAMGAIGVGVGLFLNYLLISRYGAMGAAWATLFSFASIAALAFYFSQRIYPIPYRISKLALPVVVAAPVYLLSTAVSVPSPALSVAVKLLFVPAFLGILFYLGFFDRQEVEKLKSILGKLSGRHGRRAAIFPGSAA